MTEVQQESAHEVAYRSWLRERGLPLSAARTPGAFVPIDAPSDSVTKLNVVGPIVVAVEKPDELSESESALLGKILQALGQDIRSTLIVGTSAEKTWSAIQSSRGPKFVVFFGGEVAEQQLAGLSPNEWARGKVFHRNTQTPLPLMITLPLRGLADSNESKRVVWGDLKVAMEEVKVQR